MNYTLETGLRGCLRHPRTMLLAVLTLALAGVEALQASASRPNYKPQPFRKARHEQHVHHH